MLILGNRLFVFVALIAIVSCGRQGRDVSNEAEQQSYDGRGARTPQNPPDVQFNDEPEDLALDTQDWRDIFDTGNDPRREIVLW